MIIKVELLVDISEHVIDLYKEDSRNVSQIILDKIQNHMECDTDIKIIIAEAYEGTKE